MVGKVLRFVKITIVESTLKKMTFLKNLNSKIECTLNIIKCLSETLYLDFMISKIFAHSPFYREVVLTSNVR